MLAGFGLFVSLVGVASVSPVFCSMCHSEQAEALAASSHADERCDRCHGATSFGGLLERRLQVVSMFGSAITPGRQPVMTHVDNELCLDCHDAVSTGVLVRNGIKMSHRAPLEDAWQCVECHPTTAHGIEAIQTVSYRQVGYQMDTCLECHSSNPQNITACEVCHAEGAGRERSGIKTSWQIAHGENWRQAHGMGNLETCKACHSSEYCVACHGMPIPHPNRFANAHGKQVKD